MLEAALRRKPVLFGPHTGNFREAASVLLDSGGGIRVDDAIMLAREAGRLLDDPELRRRLGEAGFEAVAARTGAVKETLELVARFLKPETAA
jgi:3-deoxy-D-manno-octulosonic-acid transferase